MDSFEKQMEERFMRDLQNIQIGDQDSQLQSSTDFYQGLKKKVNEQITSIKASTTKNTILQELKANMNKQISNAQKFQDQIKEMKFLNSAVQSAIAQQKIEQIKTKIAKQNQSKIILADEQVNLKQKQQSRIRFSETQFQQQFNFNNQSVVNQKQLKSFQKKKTNLAINEQLEKKISLANLQRQRINMQRQDELSMKYEQFVMSQFFKQRFLAFRIPKTQSIKKPISLNITKPKSTFTNLAPLSNNQKNVLPKNSPQIALKSLKKNKRVSLIPTSQVTIKIQFKKVQYIQTINENNRKQFYSIQNLSTNDKNINKFKELLQPYLRSISQPINDLQRISQIYKPKFIKNYLGQGQKISNIDISQKNDAQRSVEQIMASNTQFFIQQQKDSKKLKQFKLTFENVTNLKGIQKFQCVQYVALQYNLIKNLKQLNKCYKLIQLNLSNNFIKDAKPIQNLSELRYLNLNNNKVTEFNFYGGSLQILYIKNNQIQIVNNLNKNKYLRIADFSQNKLHQLGKGFSELYFLQELNIQKNYIETLNGIESLIMLQKFNTAHNRLKQLQRPLIFMFLNSLDLSYNQLQKINNFFLPSLQKLYITNNKLTGQHIGKTLIYLPELKEFNVDDNQLKGFSIVWFFVRYSKKLQILKYDSNEYFLSVRQKVRQLYEAIIYRNMTNIKILNHSPYDSGIKAYYESVYNSYLQKGSKLQLVDKQFKRFQQLISFLVQQNKMISNLESQNHRHRNQRFTQQNIFIEAKSIKRSLFLQKIISMLTQNIDKTTAKKRQQFILPIKIDEQIYFHHDKFLLNLLQKIHKIKSLFYKTKYKNEKRKKYFFNKKLILKNLLSQISSFITINSIRKAVKIFSKSLKQNKQQEAVITIQRYWRGYKSRKLFKKMMKKLKKNFDDSFEMQQVDLDQFEAQEFPQFNFDLPDDVNFQNYIIEPKYFEIEEQKTKKRNSKPSNKLQSITEKHQEYNPMMNNFMKEQKKKGQQSQKKVDDEKMMKQWGFQNPATLQALRWRKKRKQQMKKKQAQQNMTAAQRYQRFKNQHK